MTDWTQHGCSFMICVLCGGTLGETHHALAYSFLLWFQVLSRIMGMRRCDCIHLDFYIIDLGRLCLKQCFENHGFVNTFISKWVNLKSLNWL